MFQNINKYVRLLELTAKQYRIELMEKLINEVKQLPSKPKVFIIKANNDESSSKYVSNKLSDAMAVGADASLQVFDETCKTEEIIKFIKKLNNDKSVNGIIVQQPMYAHLDVEKIINSVSLQKDIDGFSRKASTLPQTNSIRFFVMGFKSIFSNLVTQRRFSGLLFFLFVFLFFFYRIVLHRRMLQ